MEIALHRSLLSPLPAGESHMESSMTSVRKFFRFCEMFHRVVPANAGTHTARTLIAAMKQRLFFAFEAGGDGSLRSQERPAKSLCEATSASTHGSIPPYAIGRTRWLAPGMT